jgi:hypothetical protein
MLNGRYFRQQFRSPARFIDKERREGMAFRVARLSQRVQRDFSLDGDNDSTWQ